MQSALSRRRRSLHRREESWKSMRYKNNLETPESEVAELAAGESPGNGSPPEPATGDVRSGPKTVNVRRAGITLKPDQGRVLVRPFRLANEQRAVNICARVMALSESE